MNSYTRGDWLAPRRAIYAARIARTRGASKTQLTRKLHAILRAIRDDPNRETAGAWWLCALGIACLLAGEVATRGGRW